MKTRSIKYIKYNKFLKYILKYIFIYINIKKQLESLM